MHIPRSRFRGWRLGLTSKKLLQATQIIRTGITHTAGCSYMETCIVYALCKIAIIIYVHIPKDTYRNVFMYIVL